jgi:hypothetical protein
MANFARQGKDFRYILLISHSLAIRVAVVSRSQFVKIIFTSKKYH